MRAHGRSPALRAGWVEARGGVGDRVGRFWEPTDAITLTLGASHLASVRFAARPHFVGKVAE